MVVQTELQKSSYVDGEVVVDCLGRRKWPDELKGRLVAQSFLPGVTVREVAERAGIRPNYLSFWRKLARDGKLVLPDLEGAQFVPVAVEDAPPVSAMPERTAELVTGATSSVELVKGDVTTRLGGDAPAARIAEIASLP